MQKVFSEDEKNEDLVTIPLACGGKITLRSDVKKWLSDAPQRALLVLAAAWKKDGCAGIPDGLGSWITGDGEASEHGGKSGMEVAAAVTTEDAISFLGSKRPMDLVEIVGNNLVPEKYLPLADKILAAAMKDPPVREDMLARCPRLRSLVRNIPEAVNAALLMGTAHHYRDGGPSVSVVPREDGGILLKMDDPGHSRGVSGTLLLGRDFVKRVLDMNRVSLPDGDTLRNALVGAIIHQAARGIDEALRNLAGEGIFSLEVKKQPSPEIKGMITCEGSLCMELDVGPWVIGLSDEDIMEIGRGSWMINEVQGPLGGENFFDWAAVRPGLYNKFRENMIAYAGEENILYLEFDKSEFVGQPEPLMALLGYIVSERPAVMALILKEGLIPQEHLSATDSALFGAMRKDPRLLDEIEAVFDTMMTDSSEIPLCAGFIGARRAAAHGGGIEMGI